MISINDLECFYYQIWPKSGDEYAKRLCTTQSTISRSNAKTLKTLNLKTKRDDFGEWVIVGDTKFLNMERNIHQLYRLGNNKDKLRLEATYWSRPTLATPVPEVLMVSGIMLE